MSKIKLKVCGLRNNAREVLEEIKPDFAGFIFYKKSPRYVEEKIDVPIGTKKVGVFVNSNFERITETITSQNLQVVQLHGEETPELCERVKALAEVIKVFSGNENIVETELKSYEPFIDYYLFDTRIAGQYGGSGVTFDWEKLQNLSLSKPIILSGGIGLHDIRGIKGIKNIYGIDVNSRFEINPGLKDIDLLRKLKKELI